MYSRSGHGNPVSGVSLDNIVPDWDRVDKSEISSLMKGVNCLDRVILKVSHLSYFVSNESDFARSENHAAAFHRLLYLDTMLFFFFKFFCTCE